MATNTGNLIMGPGDLYTGAFGATEPADTAFATVPAVETWTDRGGTMDGVELAVAQEFTELEVDQIVDVPERRLTKREATIKTNLAEATLDNLALGLNDAAGDLIAGSGTGATAHRVLTPITTNSATQVTYTAMIFDGLAPEGNVRRIIGRKMLQVGNVEFAYTKNRQTVFTVEFGAHYVSSSIAPFKVVDGEPV